LTAKNLEERRTFATKAVLDFVDITDEIKEIVSGSGIVNGRVTVFSPTPSCSILANERESGLLKDIGRALAKIEGAGRPAHTLHVGAQSVVVPVAEGELRLGTWQRLLLVELGSPGERTIIVQLMGE
jgi:secondary thiamine-phosphate synthase enzyme